MTGGMEWDGVEWQWRYKSTRADTAYYKKAGWKSVHMDSRVQVGWHELHTVTVLLDSRSYTGGNAGKSRGFLDDLEAKSLKIAPGALQESAPVQSENRKTGRAFGNLLVV